MAGYASTVIGVAVIFVWFLKWGYNDFKKSIAENPFGDYEEPRMAATLGVLGTFGGIVWGLLNFDPSPSTMQQSVENLLSGMQTAFVTSIVGMLLSIALKYWQKSKQKNFKSTAAKHEATIEDLIEYLKASSENKVAGEQKLSAAMGTLTAALASMDNSDGEQKILAALEKLTAALIGDGDYTIIGQMRRSNDKIISELRDFGKTLAENNSRAFIAILNETMQDFNQKLTEQFGENFKQLNIAVGRLLEWQTNYLQTIETATQNLETTLAGIDDAKNSLAQISDSAAAIQTSAASIQNLIVTANFYEQKLEQTLAEIQTLGDSAQNSVPQIVNLVKTSCKEIAELTNQISKVGNATLNRVEAISEQTIKAMLDVSRKIESTSYKQREIMDAEVKATKDAVTSAAATLREDTFKISKSLEIMMKTNDEKLQKSTENLNKNLEKVIAESIEQFGDSMYKVSKKFVEDYTPLAETLTRLVHFANDLERRRPR